MRLAASAGLGFAEFEDMTERQLEVFLEGREEFWARVRAHMAWIGAHLINVHIAKGRKVKPDDLLPKDDLKRAAEAKRRHQKVEDDDDDLSQKPTSGREFFARLREREERAEGKRFWDSKEGAVLDALLSDGAPEGYDSDALETAAGDFLEAEFEEVD